MRVDLPKDRWVEILDADDMPHAVKVAVNKIYPAADPDRPEDPTRFTPEWLDASQDLMLAHIITSWWLDHPVPAGDPAVIGALPESVHAALIEATMTHWETLGFSNPNSAASTTSSTADPSGSDSATTSAASSRKGAKPTPPTS